MSFCYCPVGQLSVVLNDSDCYANMRLSKAIQTWKHDLLFKIYIQALLYRGEQMSQQATINSQTIDEKDP